MSRKRGKNEGSIYKRPDGRWQARASFGYADGRRDRRHFYGATYEEASTKMHAAIAKYRAGSLTKSDQRTVGTWLEAWLERKRQPGGVRPLTAEQYAQHIRHYLAPLKADGVTYKALPALGAIRLDRLRAEHVQAYADKQLKHLSARTTALSLVVLRAALDAAVKFNLVSRNVAKLVDLPHAKHAPIKPLDPEQTRALLTIIKGDRFEALYVCALALGLRRGAAIGLRWADLDLEAKIYNVAGALAIQRIGRTSMASIGTTARSSLQLVDQKSVSNRAPMPLPEFVVAALKSRHAAQLRERMLAGPAWTDNDLVFTTRDGKPIEPRRINTGFKALLAKAGLPSTVRFHDLRHGSASLLLALGEHPRTVMEWLGHSGISLTMDTYAHVMPTAMRDVADKLDSLLAP
jgi:integrase